MDHEHSKQNVGPYQGGQSLDNPSQQHVDILRFKHRNRPLRLKQKRKSVGSNIKIDPSPHKPVRVRYQEISVANLSIIHGHIAELRHADIQIVKIIVFLYFESSK